MEGVIFIFVLSLTALSSADHENCSIKLAGLEMALYGNGVNQLNMENAFFPSRERSSRFLKIVYIFTDGDDGDDNNCTVTYFWSVGSFLFIQPPAVFTYTSLMFNIPSNSVDNLTIILPNECRPIVNKENEDVCKCKALGITFLDMLTRHLPEYSRINSPDGIVRDDQSSARIVCSDELKQLYYDDSGLLFFVMTLILPFGLLIMVALFVRSHRKRLEKKCIRPSNHGNMAGVVLTGVFINIFIIIVDIIALVRIFNDLHEYRDYEVKHSVNFYFIAITATLDFLATFYSFTTWFLFVGWTCAYKNCQCQPQSKFTSCLRNILKCLFTPYLYLVYGYKKHDKFWKEEDEPENSEQQEVLENVYAVRQVWALLSLLIGPLFGIFNHIGYISMAWLTEPRKTSSIFVLILALLIYLFHLFRSLYRSIESYSVPFHVRNKKIFERVVHFFEYFFHCCIICCANYDCICTKDVESIDIVEEYINDNQLILNRGSRISKVHQRKNVVIFSKAKLLSTFVVGIIATIPLALTIVGFAAIPIPSLELADYLSNIINIGLVVIATLATHKLFSLKEPELGLLMKKFKDSYETQRMPEKILSENVFEACGEIAGEVCQTLHRRNGHPTSLYQPLVNKNTTSSIEPTEEEPEVALTSV